MAAALKPMMRTEDAHSYGNLGYAAAKAALVDLARNYSSMRAAQRIRVNVVRPTSTNTQIIHNGMIDRCWEHADPDDMKVLVSAIPVLEVEPEGIANTVLWLCSGDSRYFTGNQVRIDAGANLR